MEEAIYYIHVNGEQRGPFPLSQLKNEGVTPDTMMWKAGMPAWAPASTLPEVVAFFTAANNQTPPPEAPVYPQGGQYGQQQVYNTYTRPQYQNSYAQRNGAYPPGWYNWQTWGIISIVLGFFTGIIWMVFGIIGLVKSNEANDAARRGDPYASQINSTAKTWILISLILSGVSIVLLILLFGFIFSFLGAVATL